jgi:hypothetical protein
MASDNDKNGIESFGLKYGGVVPQDRANGFLHKWHGFVDKLYSHPRSDQRYNLQVAYVYNTEYNAHVGISGDVDLIAINLGIPITIRKIMIAAVSDPDVYKPTEGVAEYPDIVSPYGCDISAMASGLFSPPTPSDPAQALLAESLANTAEIFIFEHELAHLRNGHVAWASEHLSLDDFDEIGQTGASKDFYLARQTLEWDADMAALNSLFTTLLHPRRYARPGRVQGWHLEDVDLTLRKVFHVALAVYLSCRAFPIRSLGASAADCLISIHPPAAIRMEYIQLFIIELLHERAGISIESLQLEMAWAVGIGERIWAKLTAADPVLPFSEQNERIGSELLRLYGQRWQTLHAELDPLKRGGTLAPPVPASRA